MSLIPLVFSDWWEDLDRPHRILDQNFGLGLRANDLVPLHLAEQHFMLPPVQRRRGCPLYYRPWSELLHTPEERGTSTVKANKDEFQVSLDVQQFKPEEINVKVDGKFIVVEGKHEEKKDEHGTISRHFVRKYMVPEQCDIDKVSSTLSSDGVLSVVAPRKPQLKESKDKVIKIQQTGKPAIRDEAKTEEKKDEKKK